MELTYTERNGVMYPYLALPEQTNYPIGKYGRMRLDYLKKHRRGNEKGELFLELLRRERHLIENRPTVWHHGDFHCGNLMFDEEMRLTVIDFDREDVGDPWYEFNRIIWDVRVGAEFARGLLDGYFGGRVPEKFWRILRLYLCQNMLSSLPWAAGFGDSEIQIARDNARRVLNWYDDLREIVPDWY